MEWQVLYLFCLMKYINSIFRREWIDPQKIIRHTTRDITNWERNGVDYHYVAESEFRKLENDDSLVYWEYYPPLSEDGEPREENKLYGISRSALSVLKEGNGWKRVFASVAGNGTPKVMDILDQCYKEVVWIPLYIYCNADEIEARLKSDWRPVTELLFRLNWIKNDLLNFLALEQKIQQSYLLINNSSCTDGVCESLAQNLTPITDIIGHFIVK